MYRKTEETDFSWTSYGRNGVLLIRRGVAYRKMEETDLCWSATVETGVLFIGRGPRNTRYSSYRSASVSSSSEGIARSGSVNSYRSIARVQ